MRCNVSERVGYVIFTIKLCCINIIPSFVTDDLLRSPLCRVDSMPSHHPSKGAMTHAE